MRFALLGDHPDGLSAVMAFAARGAHQLVTVCGVEAVQLERIPSGVPPRVVTDVEELLADPQVEVVVVASKLDDRPAHLRRALQSERHVLCVHPSDVSPDAAYEAGMIQGDTGHVLLPLLSGPSHPAIRTAADWLRDPHCPLGKLRLLEIEWRLKDGLLAGLGPKRNLLALPGWDILRALIGEVAEVTAYAGEEDEVPADRPASVSGRTENGSLFRILFIPHETGSRLDIRFLGAAGRAALTFPHGWPAPASFRWTDAGGTPRQEDWGDIDPWRDVVAEFEKRVGQPLEQHVAGSPPPARETAGFVSWQMETRCLELDDATRRSVERRRAILLEYPEASEEVGFKGTMTLVGCVVLWGVLGVFLISLWLPWLQWTVVPILIFFLLMQSLRWLARRDPSPIRHDPL